MKINLDFIYPIGTIYETTSTVHPNVLFGGTWELYGQGRVTVCKDTTQIEFDTIGKQGGSKDLQAHRHSMARAQLFAGEQGQANYCYGTTASITTLVSNVETQSTGSGNSGNLQPYIVVYRYRRIA